MQHKKKVFCLYRVSTLKQVDKSKDDIPMQKQACLEYIDAHPDWVFYREISEKGISGFKVSAEDRDAIQEIQQEALEQKFDILLVFMFDRLGRRDDETPFVVEWFVKQGIEVWSVSEGQQRFDTHVDKLMNYIRYWQASGESIKTSIRVKTRLSQMVQEGCYRGGTPPYGYRLEKQGRVNKKNREVYDIVIDEQESAVVKVIFDLYLTRGYGSHRIGTYLMEHGMMNRKGTNFTNTTIQHMLKNIAYMGIMKSGETITDVFPHLQIIDADTFAQVQQMITQRSRNYQDRRVPLNTRGSSLLSGNIFCGHCGARLTVTTSGKKYHRKDGEVTSTPRTRYVCYNKTRHPHKCDGQTGYTVRKLDSLIDNVVRSLFSRLGDIPKDKIIESRYTAQISALEKELQAAKSAQCHAASELVEIESEVLKVIRGTSKLNADLINQLYEQAKMTMEQSEASVQNLEDALMNSKSAKDGLLAEYDTFLSWAQIYDTCDTETKKMILSRIICAVRVKRGYSIELDFTVDCKALGLLPDEKVVTNPPD